MDVKRAIIFRQVGAKIAYYRTLRGYTQTELAERIGISVDTHTKTVGYGIYTRRTKSIKQWGRDGRDVPPRHWSISFLFYITALRI